MTSPLTAPAPSAEIRSYSLSLSCPDRPGIVHGVSGALVAAGANITESQQYGSPDTGTFFMRVALATDAGEAGVRGHLAAVAAKFGMEFSLAPEGARTRTMILVSKADHCLNDLLFQHRSGILPINIPVIVSNHPDLAGLAAFHGIEFHHIPVTSSTKDTAEAALRALMAKHDIELVVLARYMQILSDELCADLRGRAINIHHSFLPSFKGARPYHQAHTRGVKLIGATAHYVTGALDEGPIIEQEVIRVDHGRTAGQLATIGRQLEGRALVQAVQWHAEHRVLLDGTRTIVFG
ncbi:formyltetrahydrofolate deformylase [Arthrobacter sp. Br18]|uniref:formyltetrahydrofolate deformylase n=1 Tax=Arthrobacter sp. Br18 TaxID=1312954 RepID=UPI0004BC1C54|nr:formyltetrahydrofolate deformylase [Arthrobacter sp. Br18]